jgi:hypothetical protein
MLVLQIDFQKTASPASIGLDGGDTRELAVFFRSLKIEFSGGEAAVDFSAGGNLGKAALFGFWRPVSLNSRKNNSGENFLTD